MGQVNAALTNHSVMAYRRAAQTPAGDSMAVTFFYADFGLALYESTAICPRQVLCTPALNTLRYFTSEIP